MTHFSHHPLYQDEGLCAFAADTLISAGHSVFQIFQWPLTEQDHSRWLLCQADPQGEAKRVLSLGCGIGGMEHYWQLDRPDLFVELVNISPTQLERCVCRGPRRLICDNAETYHSDAGPFDLVVIAYLLGHVMLEPTLQSALANLSSRGKLMVYDVFEGTKKFRSQLLYDTPSFEQLEVFGTANGLRFRNVIEGGIPMGEFFASHFQWVQNAATPGLFIFEKP